MTEKLIDWRCPHCGGPVSAQFYARWNVAAQDWELDGSPEAADICSGCSFAEVQAVERCLTGAELEDAQQLRAAYLARQRLNEAAPDLLTLLQWALPLARERASGLDAATAMHKRAEDLLKQLTEGN